MIGFLQRLLRAPDQATQRPVPPSAFFSATGHQSRQAQLVSWDARAVELGARPLPAPAALRKLQTLWQKGHHLSPLPSEALRRLGGYLHFAAVKAQCDVIRQDECGNFMVVVLSGGLVVSRRQPWGETLRLAQTGPGALLGEMSLLDSGQRFSSCTTLMDSELAVLSAQALDDMLEHDPALAAQLIAVLARKLSVRLRAISTRLGP